jgi:hypothetical protein
MKNEKRKGQEEKEGRGESDEETARIYREN